MTRQINPTTGWYEDSYTDRGIVEREERYQYYGPDGHSTLYLPRSHYITWTGQGRKQFHSCSHRVVYSRYEEGSATSRWLDTSGWGGADPNRIGYSRGYFYLLPPFDGYSGSEEIRIYDDPGPRILPTPPSMDWGTAREELFADMLGRFQADISVPVNVAEFGQLKNLVPGMARSVRRLIKVVTQGTRGKLRVRAHWTGLNPRSWATTRYLTLYQQPRRVSLASLQWGLKDLSSSYLAAEFGVRPLIDDISNWMSKYYELKLKRNWFQSIATGRPVSFRAATTSVESANEAPCDARMEWRYAPDTIYSRTPMPVSREARISRRGILGALARVYPKDNLSQLNSQISAVLGLTSPLQTVWDIIPFSFVVDWFFPVGEAISRVDTRLFGGGRSLARKIEILNEWSTTVTEQFSGLRRDSGTILSSGRARGQVKCDFSAGRMGQLTHLYEREGGWPGLSIIPSRKGWSAFATRAAMALIIQKAL